MWTPLLALPLLAAALAAPDDEADTDDGSFGLSDPVICASVEGYEDYVPRANNALTRDEKLLLYFRPRHYKWSEAGGRFEASLTEDVRIRRKGSKLVVWSKDNLGEYKARSDRPPRLIYLRNSISLKGLKPGEYELELTLKDRIGRSKPAVRVVPFRVVEGTAPPPDSGPEPGSKAKPGRAPGLTP